MGTKNEEGNVIYLKISMDEEPESKLDQNSVSQQHQQFFFFFSVSYLFTAPLQGLSFPLQSHLKTRKLVNENRQ